MPLTPDWLKIVIPSVLGLAATIIASYFSARLGMRRAFQERWWERKERAYSEIVEALHDAIRFYESAAEEYLTHREQPNPELKDLQEKYRTAYRSLEKATDIGAFVISDEAARILLNLRERPRLDWDKDPPWEVYEQDAKFCREALAKIRPCARKDLGV